jgi:hypothetical protein
MGASGSRIDFGHGWTAFVGAVAFGALDRLGLGRFGIDFGRLGLGRFGVDFGRLGLGRFGVDFGRFGVGRVGSRGVGFEWFGLDRCGIGDFDRLGRFGGVTGIGVGLVRPGIVFGQFVGFPHRSRPVGVGRGTGSPDGRGCVEVDRRAFTWDGFGLADFGWRLSAADRFGWVEVTWGVFWPGRFGWVGVGG